MSHEEKQKVVKLMANAVMETERMSQPVALPRKLIAGLMLLGFGAVFGVLGMFAMPYSTTVGITLIVLGGVSAISGVVLVMKFGGDARFDPKPVVISPPSGGGSPVDKQAS